MFEVLEPEVNNEKLYTIALPHSGIIVKKIIDWLEHHKNVSDANPSLNTTDPWDADYFEMETSHLIAIAKAANMLDIKSEKLFIPTIYNKLSIDFT